MGEVHCESKNRQYFSLTFLLSVFFNFQNSFAFGFCKKFATKHVSCFPPQLNCVHSLQSLVRTTRRTKTANITKDHAISASHSQTVTVLQSSASRPYSALKTVKILYSYLLFLNNYQISTWQPFVIFKY